MEQQRVESVITEIGKLSCIDELRKLRDRFHEEFRQAPLLSYSLADNNRLNQVHDAFISRVVELAESALKEEGMAAPVGYAFVLFGSGGRKEQTLWSDQDNGLLYDEPEEHQREMAASYFDRLSAGIEQALFKLGYPPCSGDVSCTNVQWRMPVNEWKALLLTWFDDPTWENVRYLLIAADIRAVYGTADIVQESKRFFYDYVKEHPKLLHSMLQNTLHHKISLGVFGQLIKERYGEDTGSVDLKYGAYIPIVNGIRLLALEAGVQVTSTQERIEQLIFGGHVEEELGHDWLEAASLVIKLRSETPYRLENGHFTTRGKLTADLLTKERVNQLKFCLRIGKDLQKYVQSKIKERGSF